MKHGDVMVPFSVPFSPSDRGPAVRQMKSGELELPLLGKSSSNREDFTADEDNEED